MFFVLTLIPPWLWGASLRSQFLEHVDCSCGRSALAAVRRGLGNAPGQLLGEPGSPKRDGEDALVLPERCLGSTQKANTYQSSP